jgi:hypothetical protein
MQRENRMLPPEKREDCRPTVDPTANDTPTSPDMVRQATTVRELASQKGDAKLGPASAFPIRWEVRNIL